MTTQQAIQELHNLAADTTQSPEIVKQILLKIDKVRQLEEKKTTAEFMEKMEIQDEIDSLLGVKYERPSDSQFECEGCGS